MQPVNLSGNLINLAYAQNTSNSKKEVSQKGDVNKSDKIEISSAGKAFKKIDDFLNLGKPDRLDTSDLSPAEKEEFLKILANLLKKGIVGYEILEVNGQPEKHYIVNQIGDERIRGAKLYKKGDYYTRNDRKF